MGHRELLSMATELIAVTFRALLILHRRLYRLDLQVKTAFSAQINATGLSTLTSAAEHPRLNEIPSVIGNCGTIDVTPDSSGLDNSRMRATTIGISARLDDSKWIITYIQKINMQQH
jgi:hypothetical protein